MTPFLSQSHFMTMQECLNNNQQINSSQIFNAWDYENLDLNSFQLPKQSVLALIR